MCIRDREKKGHRDAISVKNVPFPDTPPAHPSEPAWPLSSSWRKLCSILPPVMQTARARFPPAWGVENGTRLLIFTERIPRIVRIPWILFDDETKRKGRLSPDAMLTLSGTSTQRSQARVHTFGRDDVCSFTSWKSTGRR